MKTSKRLSFILITALAAATILGTAAFAMPGDNPIKEAFGIRGEATAVDLDGNEVETPTDGVLGDLQGSFTVTAGPDEVTGTFPMEDSDTAFPASGNGIISGGGAFDLEGNPVDAPTDGELGELQGSFTVTASADATEGTF